MSGLLLSLVCLQFGAGACFDLEAALALDDTHDAVSLLQAGVKTQMRVRTTGAASVPVDREAGVGSERPRFCEAEACEAPLAAIEQLMQAEPAAAQGGSAVLEASSKASVAEATGPAQQSYLSMLLKLIALLLIEEGLCIVWRLVQKRRVDHSAVAKEQQHHPVVEDAWQSLVEAALVGDAKQSDLLLSHYPIDVYRVDAWGCSALHAAAKGGGHHTVATLLTRGAAVHDRDAWDETPLHLAARAGHGQICRVLLEHDADVNSTNADGWTPLVVAAHASQEVVCELLLDEGGTTGGLDEGVPALLSRLQAKRRAEEEVQEGERVSLLDLMLPREGEELYASE